MLVTRTRPERPPLRIALLGLGTVGAAVAGRLVDERWQEDIAARNLRPPQLVAVGVREPKRRRSVSLPDSVQKTDDLVGLCRREDIDVIVELLGGLEPAGELVGSALGSGRALVTANKALLAERGPALERTARRSGAALRFEAAVAGGVPILAPLARDMAANRLETVRGIVNGTTNFILSSMASEGREYADALVEAQRRGYAEADPSADVEGLDTVHKLVLLARLAFGAWPQPSGIARRGIAGVTAAHVAAAREHGLALKLVASVARVPGAPGGRLQAFVEPCAVERRSLVGSTDGVTNVVEVTGRPIGRVVFQGPGAGGDATSSAVLGDLMALSRGEGSTWADLPEATIIGEMDDGRQQGRRWLCCGADGGSRIVDAAAAAEAPEGTTTYRVLEDD
jgi:homoserine dehydrogenase